MFDSRTFCCCGLPKRAIQPSRCCSGIMRLNACRGFTDGKHRWFSGGRLCLCHRSNTGWIKIRIDFRNRLWNPKTLLICTARWRWAWSSVWFLPFGWPRVGRFALSALSFGAVAAGWRALLGSVAVSALMENADKPQSDIPAHPATAGANSPNA